MTDIQTVGGLYAQYMLNEWMKIKEKATEYRGRMLAGEASDPDTKRVTRDYVALMTDFWGQLLPKVRGRNDDSIPKSFEDEFEKFERNIYAPTTMISEENAGDIFKLDATLREAVERLRITMWE